MKKILLLSLLSVSVLNAFAQKPAITTHRVTDTYAQNLISTHSAAHKLTGDGDTTAIFNVSATDTPYTYSYTGVGSIYGMNTLGMKGFAERFDINGQDSTVTVIGAYYWFSGSHNSNSTKTVNLSVWSMGAPQATNDPTFFYSGFPTTALTTQPVAFTSVYWDSLAPYGFATPAANINNSFFVGFEVSYDTLNMGGDTLNVLASQDGGRTSSFLLVSGSDTLVNDVTVAETPSGTWIDAFADYTSDFSTNPPTLGPFNDFYIAPIIAIHYTGVTSVSRKNLSFFGNYPNPATNSTNIKIALKNSADVTITVMDMTGKTVNTIQKNNMSSGEHIVSVETAALPAGNYLYTVSTNDGTAIASKFTVIK